MIKIREKDMIRMKIQNISIIFFCLFLIYSCKSQKINHSDYETYCVRKIGCEVFLNYIKKYWQEDSLGAYGFRQFILNDINGNCNLQGQKWQNFSPYFGNPIRVTNTNQGFELEYRVTNYPVYFQKITFVIGLEIDSSTISYFNERIYD